MGNSASFGIDSKAFFLAFDGGRMDSYSIIEKQGKHLVLFGLVDRVWILSLHAW